MMADGGLTATKWFDKIARAHACLAGTSDEIEQSQPNRISERSELWCEIGSSFVGQGSTAKGQ